MGVNKTEDKEKELKNEVRQLTCSWQTIKSVSGSRGLELLPVLGGFGVDRQHMLCTTALVSSSRRGHLQELVVLGCGTHWIKDVHIVEWIRRVVAVVTLGAS